MIGVFLIGLVASQDLPPASAASIVSEQASGEPPGTRGPLKHGADDAAVMRMQTYGRCAAQRQPSKAAAVLRMDFRTPEYRSALTKLATSEASCMGPDAKARFGSVLFAGALAEQLLGRHRDLAAALTFDPGRRPVQTFSQSDYMAACVARTSPEKVARLFATRWTSDAEKAAMTDLMPAVRACAPKGERFRFNLPGLRAILATASYRIAEAG